MNHKIFVALSAFSQFSQSPLNLLKESGCTHSINPHGRRLVRDEIIEMGHESEGIIAGVEPYDEYVLDRLPNLRCISRCGVGIDSISVEGAKKRGVEIRNTPDVVIQPVVELTVAMIFDLLRKLTSLTILLRAKKWERRAGHLLKGQKIGILGLGRIGKKMAEVMTGLETEVYGTDLFPDKQWAERWNVKIVPLNELLRIADILSVNLSVVKENTIKLGEDEFRKMKEGSIIVNTSRGQFIDETALYNALISGHLSGAALDVFTEEPYLGKLCELNNVVLTPHVASLTKESRIAMELEAVQNLIDYFKSS
ncbi:phosphoglycerate dehydrogenase [Acidobacteriota bacterium]